ncbi:hypothetical protein HOLleu_01008 [Holothuria leucospilota]|uniref:UEV domain-containing protein n=1 Tax=Holothuria leucospilota TaxID=206669 RepID=A0A9Q1CNH3_HOLLE|nr:hypothetical protein HOLleu_01008 [Holothuria leucospilota]
MAAHEAYIKQHLSKYRHKALTKAALLSTIKTFPGLRPEEDTFVFHDLKKTSLLSLNGTIPVLYKGKCLKVLNLA